MATAAYEVAHLSEHLDAESHTPVAPHRRGRWLVGLALAVAGCMGVAVGVARARKPASPLERLSTIRKHLVKAFSSRALLEETDLQTTASFLWNEEGAEDPSAMGVKAVFKQGTAKYDGLELKLTFVAQEGKGADLVAKLKATLHAVDDVYGDGSSRQFVKFSQEGDEAVIVITPPAEERKVLHDIVRPSEPHLWELHDLLGMQVVSKYRRQHSHYYGDDDDDDDDTPTDKLTGAIEGAIEAIGKHTQFEAELFVGRTVQEMYKHKHTSIVLVPKGIKGSVHMKVASALFDPLYDIFYPRCDRYPAHRTGPEDAQRTLAVIKSLASCDSPVRLFYKSEDKLNGVLDRFPSFGSAIHDVMRDFFEYMPPIVRGNITGIDALMDGVKSFEIVGLPHKWEVVATFTNFHIAPLIHDCLAEFPGNSRR